MSADNWAKCPQCAELSLKRKKEIKQLYGKIPEIEYSELLRKQKEIEEKDECTLREDYEIGIFEGIFEVSYSGHCSKCGFEKQFSHNETIKIG